MDFDDKDLQLKLNDAITIDLRWPTMSDRSVEVKTGTEVLIHMVAKSIGTLYHGKEIHLMKDVPFEEVVEFVESLSSEQFNKILTHFTREGSRWRNSLPRMGSCGTAVHVWM